MNWSRWLYHGLVLIAFVAVWEAVAMYYLPPAYAWLVLGMAVGILLVWAVMQFRFIAVVFYEYNRCRIYEIRAALKSLRTPKTLEEVDLILHQHWRAVEMASCDTAGRKQELTKAFYRLRKAVYQCNFAVAADPDAYSRWPVKH